MMNANAPHVVCTLRYENQIDCVGYFWKLNLVKYLIVQDFGKHFLVNFGIIFSFFFFLHFQFIILKLKHTFSMKSIMNTHSSLMN